MKNSKFINLTALKDSFVLVRKYFEKEEDSKPKKGRSILDIITENTGQAVPPWSDAWSFYNSSEFKCKFPRNLEGDILVPPEHVLELVHKK